MFQYIKYIRRRGGGWQPVWSYSWTTGNWGACSVTCGGGTQTRAVTCVRNGVGNVADSFCAKAGIAKPATSQSCNTHSCYTYSWYSGGYGSCPTSCGVGSQTRTVYCRRNDGVQVSDSYCTGSKPATSKQCTVCTSCVFNESAYLRAKVKQCNAIRHEGRSNWTVSQVRSAISALGITPSQHWSRYGKYEGVCPWSSTACCAYGGYDYSG